MKYRIEKEGEWLPWMVEAFKELEL